MICSRANEGALADLLAHARARVPFYRDAGPGLSDFPVVSKGAMLARQEDFIAADPGLERSGVAELLRAPAEGPGQIAVGGEVLVEQTSGSSGIPFRIPKTKAERLRVSLGLWRFRRSIDPEFSPRTFLALIHNPGLAERPRTMPELFSSIARGRHRWLHASTALLPKLLRHLRDSGSAVPPSLRHIECSGFFLEPEIRSAVEKEASVGVVDQYGCTEVWAIGYGIGPGVFAPVLDNVVLEILDASGAALEAEGAVGRVVVTSLWQRLFPFIRYDTGDTGKLVRVGGDLGLELLPRRPHHLVRGARGAVWGTDLFKSILYNVYQEIGHRAVSRLEVRQLGPAKMALVMSAHPDAEAIRSRIEAHLNARGVFDWPVRLSLETAGAEDDPSSAEKPCLFTNRAWSEAAPTAGQPA